jgi:hypothetical protein
MSKALETLSACLLPLFFFVGLGSLSGQNVSVDEGAFRIAINGEIVGREDFSIRRVGVGEAARIILRATVELDLPEGRRNLVPAMRAGGGDVGVMDYQMKISGSQVSEVYVSRSGSRFLAKVISARGEDVREFRAGPGSVLMDRHVAHQHHLLLPFLDGPDAVSLTVLAPEEGQQFRMTLSSVGEEEVRVGTELVRGRHFRLEGEDGSRDIWFDEQGRILRVENANRGYVAERESLG